MNIHQQFDNMIYWSLLLHLYQPPTQTLEVLDRICNECYRPLIKVFKENENARVTMNICGSLTEQLERYGYDDIISGLGELADLGRIEFTGSAKYHPILPLIPESEMRRQIHINYKTNSHAFGNVYKPEGFFPPEMCYSKNIIPAVLHSGHKWIILAGIGCPEGWPVDVLHTTETRDGRLHVFYRDDYLSNAISFNNIQGGQKYVSHLRDMFRTYLKGETDEGNYYVITAMDGETFGHHIKNADKTFLDSTFKALKEETKKSKENENAEKETNKENKKKSEKKDDEERKKNHGNEMEEEQKKREKATEKVEMVHISELIDLFRTVKVVEPRQSSWSTTQDDILRNNPYPLWKSPENRLHELQWTHLSICIDLVNEATNLSNNHESKRYADHSRNLLDKALHSCQFWWASRRPWWDINMIFRGLQEQQEVLINAYKAIQSSTIDEATKKQMLYYRVLSAMYISNNITEILLSIF